MNKDFTLIIPTHNRHHYLKRILEFYENYEFLIKIYDSSDKKFSDKILKKLSVEYIHCPDFSFSEKFSKSIIDVTTKYVLYCADDDFIFPNAISAAYTFLENNNEYVCAKGKILTYIYYAENKEFHFEYKSYIDINLNTWLIENDAIKRFKYFSSPYQVTMYAIHKTVNLKEIYTKIEKYKIKQSYLCELTQAIMTILSGKVADLDLIFQLREISNLSLGKTDKTVLDLYSENHDEIKSLKELLEIELIKIHKKNNKILIENMFKDLFIFIKEWQTTTNKRVHFLSFPENPENDYDKKILLDFYNKEPLLSYAVSLIKQYNIDTGFKKKLTINSQIVKDNVLIFYNSFLNLVNSFENQNMRIIFYGAGTIINILLNFNMSHNIIGIVDQDTSLHGNSINNIPILPIEVLSNKSTYDVIIITVLGQEDKIINLLKKNFNITKPIFKIIPD